MLGQTSRAWPGFAMSIFVSCLFMAQAHGQLGGLGGGLGGAVGGMLGAAGGAVNGAVNAVSGAGQVSGATGAICGPVGAVGGAVGGAMGGITGGLGGVTGGVTGVAGGATSGISGATGGSAAGGATGVIAIISPTTGAPDPGSIPNFITPVSHIDAFNGQHFKFIAVEGTPVNPVDAPSTDAMETVVGENGVISLQRTAASESTANVGVGNAEHENGGTMEVGQGNGTGESNPSLAGVEPWQTDNEDVDSTTEQVLRANNEDGPHENDSSAPANINTGNGGNNGGASLLNTNTGNGGNTANSAILNTNAGNGGNQTSTALLNTNTGNGGNQSNSALLNTNTANGGNESNSALVNSNLGAGGNNASSSIVNINTGYGENNSSAPVNLDVHEQQDLLIGSLGIGQQSNTGSNGIINFGMGNESNHGGNSLINIAIANGSNNSGNSLLNLALGNGSNVNGGDGGGLLGGLLGSINIGVGNGAPPVIPPIDNPPLPTDDPNLISSNNQITDSMCGVKPIRDLGNSEEGGNSLAVKDVGCRDENPGAQTMMAVQDNDTNQFSNPLRDRLGFNTRLSSAVDP